MVENLVQNPHVAKSLSFALAALLLLAPAWLLAAPRVITLSRQYRTGLYRRDHAGRRQQLFRLSFAGQNDRTGCQLAGMNPERIVALARRVLPARGQCRTPVNQLQSLGIHVLWVQTSTIEEIIATLRELAQWSPQPESTAGGAGDAAGIRCVESALCQRAEETRLPVRPAPLFTSGPGSIQDQVLRLCGGENIFATSRVPAAGEPRTGAGPPAAGDRGHRGCQPHCRSAALWQHQLTISLIALHSDWFERAAHVYPLAAKQLCAALDRK